METIGHITTNPGSWETELEKSDKHDNTIQRGELNDRKENEEESGYEETKERFRRGSRPHSTPMTLRWLEDNYETAEGVCIPRSTLYIHYLDFCEENDTNPVNAASFGKIIRQQFPQITTRRLGTRGQSKYHYYGIGVKESSAYYEVIYSAKGVQTLGEGKKDTTKQIVAYSPRSKLGTLLPPFPDVKDLNLASEVDEQKVVTFIMMYRTHCQRILDTVIRANFDEVQNFLHHFWQGMPPHITPILGTQTLIHLVGACDSILYKAVSNVLMPTVLQPFPESLTQVIRQFASQLEDWLTNALSGMPAGLQDLKLDLSRRFSQVLRRQLSVNHLVQAARTVVNSPDVMGQMLSDWLMIDIGSIVQQTLYTMDESVDKDSVAIFNFCTDFEKLLDEQAPLESYVEWLDAMINTCVVKQSFEKRSSLKTVSRQFLFLWTCFGTRVIRDLTLQSAASFGSFHLLHLMLDDYVLYRIECLLAEYRAKCLLGNAKGEKDSEASVDDVILPDSSQVTMPLGPLITSPVSRYGHPILFDDHMLDYDSQSDGFSSDEDGDDDEDNDEDSFLRSPFEILGGVSSPVVHNVPNSLNLAVPSSESGSFQCNLNMKLPDHHLQQHQHHPHQHHMQVSVSNRQSEFQFPAPHHEPFFHPHHPHQQLPTQPMTPVLYHSPHYLSKPAETNKMSSGFSTPAETTGVPAMAVYPGQFSAFTPSRHQAQINSNLQETRTFPGDVVKIKTAVPFVQQGSTQAAYGGRHLDYHHHGNNNALTSVLSLPSQEAPPFSSDKRGGLTGLKRKHDVPRNTCRIICEQEVTTSNIMVKDDPWSQSSSTSSYIN